MIAWLVGTPWGLALAYSLVCASMYAGMIIWSELWPDDTQDH